MSTHLEEVAYVTGRIEQSKALAAATISMSARASHEGIVKAYEERLAALTGANVLSESAAMEQPVVDQGPDDPGGRRA